MKSVNLLVLGSAAVGKSNLSLRFTQNCFEEEYEPTIQNIFQKAITLDRHTYQLDITDTAGMETGDVMRPVLFKSADIFILIYDVCDKTTFEHIEGLHEDIIRIRGLEAPVPCMILANKVDKVDEREVSTEEGQKAAKSMNAAYYETSAKTGQGVQEGFEQAVREFLKTKPQEKPSKRCLLL